VTGPDGVISSVGAEEKGRKSRLVVGLLVIKSSFHALNLILLAEF
jgi:hypothetical protein